MPRRGRGRGRGGRAPIQVISVPIEVRPVQSLAIDVNLRGAGRLARNLPSFLLNMAFRVTSCDLTIAAASPQSIDIRLYSGTGLETSSEATVKSRALLAVPGPQQVRLRNSRYVQHALVSSPVEILTVIPGGVDITTVYVVGVVHVSVLGSL